MHITQNDYQDFQCNHMDTENMIRFLEHLDNCDFCLNQMLQTEEPQCCITPAYLKEQILSRAASPDIRAACTVHNTSRRLHTLYHSVCTMAGVAAALFLLFMIGQTNHSGLLTQLYSQQLSIREAPALGSRNRVYDFSQTIADDLGSGFEQITDYISNIPSKLFNGGE